MKNDPVRKKRRNLKRSALSRGLSFQLSRKHIADLLETKRCYYTGRELTESTFSIDRKDCSKGYIEGNVVACVKDVNFFKSHLIEDPDTRLSNDELRTFLSRMAEFVHDDN